MIPIPCPQKILWVSPHPQNPKILHTHTHTLSFHYKRPILICCLSHWQLATTWCMDGSVCDWSADWLVCIKRLLTIKKTNCTYSAKLKHTHISCLTRYFRLTKNPHGSVGIEDHPHTHTHGDPNTHGSPASDQTTTARRRAVRRQFLMMNRPQLSVLGGI